MAANELYKLDQVAIRMVSEPPLYSSEPVTTPEAAVRLISDLLKDYDREAFVVVACATDLTPINFCIASLGTLDMTVAHPRELAKSLILSSASSMLLAHNHPSKNLVPSRQDAETTDKMVQLGELLGIPVLDHVIVGDGEHYYSFKEHGILPIARTSYAQSADEVVLGGKAAGIVADEGKDYQKKAGHKKSRWGTHSPQEARQYREEKISEITKRLEEGVQSVFESDNYRNLIAVMARFHRYSLNNQILIAMQTEGKATLVAGYQAWQKNFGRHVKKGEKGIQIIAPSPYRQKLERDRLDPGTNERVLDAQENPEKEVVEVERTAFRVTTVFDVSQTEGKELPTLGVDELQGSVDGYQRLVEALVACSPVPVVFTEVEGSAKGFYSSTLGEIHVQQGMSEQQTLKTLIHEISHSILHSPEYAKTHPEAAKKDRNTKEVEAESIAHVVCARYQVDSSSYSWGYIAGWSSGKEMPELKASLQTIKDTSEQLIVRIDEKLEEMSQAKRLAIAMENAAVYHTGKDLQDAGVEARASCRKVLQRMKGKAKEAAKEMSSFGVRTEGTIISKAAAERHKER